MTKHLTIDINKSFSWYIYIFYIKLPEYSVEQLLFWKEFIRDEILAQMNRVRVLYIVMPVT